MIVSDMSAMELMQKAVDVCMNRAEMAGLLPDEDFMVNDYIAVAHMLTHGIEVLEILERHRNAAEATETVWMPYVELACRILRIDMEGFYVKDL
jgi:hypothetical protein